jgi:chitodextrinase
VLFAAEGSRDPQDLPLAYAWTFADGATASGAEVTHVFAAPGAFKVVLTVTNEKGLADSDALTVQVAQGNRPPVASLAAADPAPSALSLAASDDALHVMAGDKVSFDASKSTDPDNDPLLAAWDFGDGATGAGTALTHVFTEPGRYAVSLRVSDTSGAGSSAARMVAVSWNGTLSGSFALGEQASSKDHAFPLAAGARSLTVTLSYDPAVANDLTLVVKDAKGAEVCRSESGLAQPGSTGPVGRSCHADAAKLATAAPGAWTAQVVRNSGVQVDYQVALLETL